MSLGRSILLGLGAITGTLALLGLAGVPLTATLAVVVVVLVVAGMVIAGRRVVTRQWADAGAGVSTPGASLPGRSTPLRPAELLVLAAIVGLFGVAAARTGFYPVSAMDAHAYDGRARWIVAERTLNLSIYDTPGLDGRSNLTYPPGYPLSLALVYWFGGDQGKVIDLAWLGALLLVVFDFVRRRRGRLPGLVTVFLILAAPEFWRHASLGLTNLATTAALAAGTLAIVEDESPWPAAALFGTATLLRVDAVVPILAATLVAAAWRRRPAWLAAALPALVVALGWQLILNDWIGSGSAAALRRSPVPDPALLGASVRAAFAALARPELYGGSFLVFAAGVVAAVARRRALPAGTGLLIALVLGEFLAILALYQQIDPSFGGGGGSYFVNSLKRALFVLMPPAAVAGVLALAPDPGHHRRA